jgi:UDP-N-acetylglucosamine 4,6-dehydratase/5-epimerase
MKLADFSGRTVVITGGTGSFGKTMTRDLLGTEVAEVRIFSRDEEKQDAMRHDMADPRLRFYIGDVRDHQGVEQVVAGADYVFHAAALKQVPSCEFFPVEAVRTNMLGSSNVIEAAAKAGVSTVVCLSTDKAVRPVNAMGMSKALMEKTAQAFARNHPTSATTVCVTRYGNVMYSRGSVIPLFVQQIKRRQPVTVTDPEMTRFMMTLAESVDLVKYAFTNARPGDLLIRKAPGCNLKTLIAALAELFEYEPEVRVIGVRHGEKMHETLATAEELSRSDDAGDYFRIRLDARGLNYRPYFDEGEPELTEHREYSSDSTEQLDVEGMIKLLLRVPEVAREMESKL